jgi:DNA polymerase
MTDEEIKEQIVNPWREAHPQTVKFWYDLERAALAAVENPGSIQSARGIAFSVKEGYLKCRLPSGRLLYYYDPRILPVMTSWGEAKEAVTYMTVDSLTKKWVRVGTYAGKIAENASQAVARDIMVEGMLRVEAAGYPIVLTVHDEIVSEVPGDFGSIEEFKNLMCAVPTWAWGLPLDANVFRSKRYKK